VIDEADIKGTAPVKLLLDTRVWLWALQAPSRLNSRVRAELKKPANELWLSPVSTWEALLLNDRGRIRRRTAPDDQLRPVVRLDAANALDDARSKRREDRLTSGGIAIRQRPSAVWMVAVFVPAAGAWITPSSEICSMNLIFLILSFLL
jgi:hypothetical protein